jgi:phosphate transport system protein
VRGILEKKIQNLLDEVLILGSMVEEALLSSVKALKDRDLKASEKIFNADEKINEKRFKLEEETIAVIATQQPMARDLRVLAAILEVITELERIGDYAKGIANISLMIANEPLLKPLIDVPKMADITVDMLHRALVAFVNNNKKKARKIPEEDDKVDELYNMVYMELMELIAEDSSRAERANYLLWVAHNLERSADRVTNICERTIYVATGELSEQPYSDHA